MDAKSASTSVMSETQMDHSHTTIDSGPLIIRETVYGIVKRVEIFVEQIEAYRKRKGIRAQELKVLDVGCGTGVNITIPLANAGYSLMGLDTDSTSIERGPLSSRGFKEY